MAATADPRTSARSASAASSARRTRASSAARATTSTTSSCPGCSTARSCAARSRTRGSSRSTPRRRSRTRTSPRSSPARTSRRSASPGCRRSPATPRRCSPATRSASRARRSRSSSPTTATRRSDALALIDVDYEPLPAVVNARKALDADAPVIRDDKAGQTRQPHHPDWEAGDEAATDARVRRGRHGRLAGHHLPALPPGAAGDLRLRRRLEPGDRAARHLQRIQAPHAHRTVFALVAGLPEHNIRVMSHDIGGGFGNKVPVYPGYVSRSPPRSSPASRSSGSRTAPRT